jgi:hypothetical protein
MAKSLEISVNIVFSAPLSTEDSMYDVTTREQAIKDIYQEIKRRIEDNVPEFSQCAPIISHKIKRCIKE